MDDATIREIADQISNQVFSDNWKLYTAVAALSLIGGFIANFVSAFARKKGEMSATAAALDDIRHQQQVLTRATEEIRVSLSQSALQAAEYRQIRREKLERLLFAVYETKDWLNALQKHALFGQPEPSSPDAQVHVDTIGTLYFPELKSQLVAFDQACDSVRSYALKCQTDALNLAVAKPGGATASNLSAARQELFESRQMEMVKRYRAAFAELRLIREGATALMAETILPPPVAS